MNRPLIIFIAFVTGCLTLQNCGEPDTDCPDKETQVIRLNASELSKVAYTGFDTLRFLSKNGDTATVMGTGKRYDYDEVASDPGGADCPGTMIKKYEKYEIRYISLKGQLEFTVIASKLKGFQIRAKNFKDYFLISFGSIGIGNEGDEYYIDSLTINSRLYTKINSMIAFTSNGAVSRSTHKCLYNIKWGLLLVKFNEEEFSLLN